MFSQKEITETLYKSMEELGLSENEINLYALSLSMGAAPVSVLAKHMSISRPNLYKVINGLEEKGLANFSAGKSYKKNFLVQPPTVVTELLRKRREKLASLEREAVYAMPDLLAMYKQGESPALMQVLQGEQQFIKFFDQILEEIKDETEFFGSVQDFADFVSYSKERSWIIKRIQKNIKIKALVFDAPYATEIKNNDKKELRETRVLKELKPFVTSYELFGNKVVIWQPKAAAGLVIADQYIVEMLRNIFNYFWNKAL